MDPPKLQLRNRYYSVLGISADASTYAIRSAYKKLAMKWHPDKCTMSDRAEAKRKFQEIQEAYAVLSDERKKMLYDNGLYDPEDDDEDIEGFSSFLNEMSVMMADVQSTENSGKGSSFEELQQLFLNMFSADLAGFSNPCPPSTSCINFEKKRAWGGGDYDPTPYIESCRSERFTASQTHSHHFFNDTSHHSSYANTSSSKKTKCGNVLHTSTFASGLSVHMTTHDNRFDNKGR